MDEHTEYLTSVQKAVLKKSDWYNNVEFPRMLEKYRLLFTCVRNIYDMLIQKNLITADPYRFDKKISDIKCPDTSDYGEPERNLVIGKRLSDYDAMLDFVCSFTRFSVENITLPKIKKLQDLNACFNWDDFSTSSTKPNTRGLATLLAEARTNAPQIVQSMINDHTTKCSTTTVEINQMLNALIRFQRELYKITVRKDLMEHPSFNKEKAFSSPEAELTEIKRIFSDATGKKPFYTELINEIIAEDIGPNSKQLRAEVLSKLEIKEEGVKKVVKKEVDTKSMLMSAILVLGAMAPTYKAFSEKISFNFELLHVVPQTPWAKFVEALKKALGIKPKEIHIHISATDPVTKHKISKEIKIHELLDDINKKERLYSGIATRGAEFQKIAAAQEEQILTFMGKHISENQNLFNTITALDEYFKSAVSQQNRAKVKGMRIELDTMRNTIINANKKRGEYQATIEEAEQMKKLGITND